MRVGGEYRGEGERDRTKWQARIYFLEAIAKRTPEVLESLHDSVLPTYADAYQATKPPPAVSSPSSPFGNEVEQTPDPKWTDWSWDDRQWGPNNTSLPTEVSNLRDQILEWAKDVNLRDDWILNAALRTLHDWYVQAHQKPNLADLLENEHEADTVAEAQKALRQEVVPFFDAAVEATTSEGYPLPQWLTWSGSSGNWLIVDEAHDLATRWPELRELREAMVEWAEKYLWSTALVLDTVLKTLKHWSDKGPALRFSVPTVMDISDTPPFEFEFPPWTPEWTPRSEYRKTVTTQFKKDLQAYLDTQARRAEERGLEPSPEIRPQQDRGPLQHFEWLAVWQVKEEMSYDDIAEEVGVSKTETATGWTSATVGEAIRKKAKLIGLTRHEP